MQLSFHSRLGKHSVIIRSNADLFKRGNFHRGTHILDARNGRVNGDLRRINTKCDADIESLFRNRGAVETHTFRQRDRIGRAVLHMKMGAHGMRHRVDHMIHLYYDRNFTLSDIAQNSGISAPYLSTTFRNELGITLKDYLAHIRTKQAMKLLRESDLKVAEIAEQVGLPDARYFSRVFREHVGITPTEYRISGKETDANVVREIY